MRSSKTHASASLTCIYILERSQFSTPQVSPIFFVSQPKNTHTHKLLSDDWEKNHSTNRASNNPPRNSSCFVELYKKIHPLKRASLFHKGKIHDAQAVQVDEHIQNFNFLPWGGLIYRLLCVRKSWVTYPFNEEVTTNRSCCFSLFSPYCPTVKLI